MKGGGKKGNGKGKGGGGRFEGNCSHCGLYGHRMNQCWKKDEEMNAWRAQQGKGDGKGKGKSQGKGWGQQFKPKGKGKGGYGLNLWDFYDNYGGAHQNTGNPQGQSDSGSAWNLHMLRASPPPGLEVQNSFEILAMNEVMEIKEEEFPDISCESEPKHKKMPKMGNYSKNKMRKPLHVFVPIPKKMELNPAVHQNTVIGKEVRDGWIRIKGVMDSGASESVAPPQLCPHIPVVPSKGSLAGQEYTSASKDIIYNLGEQVVDAVTESGRSTKLKYQIAEVSRPLNSISEICDAGGDQGQMVVFGRSGGAVVNLTTGEQTPFQREEGIYCLDVWTKLPEDTGFPRQGR